MDALRSGAIFKIKNLNVVRSPPIVKFNVPEEKVETKPSAVNSHLKAVRDTFDNIYRATPVPRVMLRNTNSGDNSIIQNNWFTGGSANQQPQQQVSYQQQHNQFEEHSYHNNSNYITSQPMHVSSNSSQSSSQYLTTQESYQPTHAADYDAVDGNTTEDIYFSDYNEHHDVAATDASNGAEVLTTTVNTKLNSSLITSQRKEREMTASNGRGSAKTNSNNINRNNPNITTAEGCSSMRNSGQTNSSRKKNTEQAGPTVTVASRAGTATTGANNINTNKKSAHVDRSNGGAQKQRSGSRGRGTGDSLLLLLAAPHNTTSNREVKKQSTVNAPAVTKAPSSIAAATIVSSASVGATASTGNSVDRTNVTINGSTTNSQTKTTAPTPTIKAIQKPNTADATQPKVMVQTKIPKKGYGKTAAKQIAPRKKKIVIPMPVFNSSSGNSSSSSGGGNSSAEDEGTSTADDTNNEYVTHPSKRKNAVTVHTTKSPNQNNIINNNSNSSNIDANKSAVDTTDLENGELVQSKTSISATTASASGNGSKVDCTNVNVNTKKVFITRSGRKCVPKKNFQLKDAVKENMEGSPKKKRKLKGSGEQFV